MKYTLPSHSVLYAFLIITLLIFGTFGFLYETGLPPWLMALMAMLLGGLVFVAAQFIIQILAKWVNRIPRSLSALLLAMLFSLWFAKWMGFRMPDQIFYPAGIGLAVLALFAVFSLKNRDRLHWSVSTLGIISPFILLAVLIGWFADEGQDPYAEDLRPPKFQEKTRLLSSEGLSNPAAPGKYSLESFTYGSGQDKHRPEFKEGVKFTTSSVDASLLLPEWKGKKKKWRERYWGFGVKNFPLNGRVYLPEGNGPFPLALVVHGNHSMIDYSDEGYSYLGELLASRGIIAVSVDENFINGHWSGDFQGREMPARAWLLLKHLELWNSWNQDSEHQLFEQIDMDHIMLVGHSRGGEAVSIAAAFNNLPYFPDNARQEFDFHFGIKGVVSIAPTDYRYQRQIQLENVNYLSLQGAYDADEVSFWGMRNYRRLQFTDGQDWFKAGVYIHRANHGQFNSTWGRADFGPPSKWTLNTYPLIPGEEQREVAKIFISAFAEAALKNNAAYLPLFENVSFGRDWLPSNYYLTHFQDYRDSLIQDYEEDINLVSGRDGNQIQAENLKIWHEEKLSSRTRMSQENNVAVLGWDYGTHVRSDSIASYSLLFPKEKPLNLDSADQVLIALGAGNYKTLDKFRKKSKADKKDKEDKREEPVLDFHLDLEDQSGRQARIKISEVKAIAPPLKVKFMKLKSLATRIGKPWEVQLESFALPLSAFEGVEQLDLQQITKIQLTFDVCPYGVVVVDEIGFSRGDFSSSNI